MEELETEIEVGEWIDTMEYDYPNFHLSMERFLCEVKKEELVLKEKLGDVEWLPADVIVNFQKKSYPIFTLV